MSKNVSTALKALLASRDELLTKCAVVDRAAGLAREAGRALTDDERAGFDTHTKLRALEHQLAKMRECK